MEEMHRSECNRLYVRPILCAHDERTDVVGPGGHRSKWADIVRPLLSLVYVTETDGCRQLSAQGMAHRLRGE